MYQFFYCDWAIANSKRYGNKTYNIYKLVPYSRANTITTVVNSKNTLNMDKLKERCKRNSSIRNSSQNTEIENRLL